MARGRCTHEIWPHRRSRRNDIVFAGFWDTMLLAFHVGLRTENDVNRTTTLLSKLHGAPYKSYIDKYGRTILQKFILEMIMNGKPLGNKREVFSIDFYRKKKTKNKVKDRLNTVMKDGTMGFDVWLA